MSNAHNLDTLRMPLTCLLDELAVVLQSLTDDQYTRKLPEVFNSSISNHVRHELDHIAAFLLALATGSLNYDQRQRGTDVETHRAAALAAVNDLLARLKTLPDEAIVYTPISLNVILSADAPPAHTTTTATREAAFVISHTIHHNAVISVMVRMLGGSLPPRFGYAPSTLVYLRDQNH